ncbi:hypothetical protein [Parasitella parasitica]|uniref:Uncharacterized protein n=1 Tax=Parasitella parasitica TaxID=35722 RepID=A0A0B7MZH0_9FUNG|nr:hypothetical protein [Parasitella parasitica]
MPPVSPEPLLDSQTSVGSAASDTKIRSQLSNVRLRSPSVAASSTSPGPSTRRSVRKRSHAQTESNPERDIIHDPQPNPTPLLLPPLLLLLLLELLEGQ